ncbi:MAG: dienelactone hydrolase family protein [Pelagibacteraceae bacterium]|jgi:phospholipase/carboxylesterase
MSLKCLELKNSTKTCSRLIFILHGYGADANDLHPIATYWQRFLPDTFFCLPNAPNICQVNSGGFEWFDLLQTNEEKIINESLVSLKKLEDTINKKINILGLDYEKLILVGFSQGTMMSIQYAIRQNNEIGGVLGYSGKIYNYNILEKELRSKPKMKFLHGNIDEIVPVEEMHKSVDFLKKKQFNVNYQVYENLGHSISHDGMSAGLSFIKNII